MRLRMPLEKSLKERMMVLNEMDEIRLLAFQTRETIQKHRKEWYDRYLKDEKKTFRYDDWHFCMIVAIGSILENLKCIGWDHIGLFKSSTMVPYNLQIFKGNYCPPELMELVSSSTT